MTVQSGAARSFRRPAILLAILAIAAGVAWVVPMRLRIAGAFVLEPMAHARVRAPVSGLVSEVLVREGARIEAGQPVARLDRTAFESEKAQAEAALDRARADLKGLEAGARVEEITKAEARVSVAHLNAESASKALDRCKDLSARGLVSQEEHEAAVRACDVAARELQQVESELQLLRAGTRTEEIQAAQAHVRELEQSVKQAEHRLEYTLITAPISGTVVTREPEALRGKVIEAGAEICEISCLDALVAQIAVPEREIADVSVGAPIALKAASLPSDLFKGTVEGMAPVVDELTEGRAVRVRCTVKDSTARLRPGMTGEARIDAGERRALEIFGRKFVRMLRVEFWW